MMVVLVIQILVEYILVVVEVEQKLLVHKVLLPLTVLVELAHNILQQLVLLKDMVAVAAVAEK
jgi:hypothetical protein